jgi:hypothetical protein
MNLNFLQDQFVRENSCVYRKYSEPNSIWEVCGSNLDRHTFWRDWGFSWNFSSPSVKVLG